MIPENGAWSVCCEGPGGTTRLDCPPCSPGLSVPVPSLCSRAPVLPSHRPCELGPHPILSCPNISLFPSPGRCPITRAECPLAALLLSGVVGWALPAEPCPDRPPEAPPTALRELQVYHLSRDVLRLLALCSFKINVSPEFLWDPARQSSFRQMKTSALYDSRILGWKLLYFTYVLLTLKDTCAGVKLENVTWVPWELHSFYFCDRASLLI